MNTTLRRLPGFAIALIALALSASLAFAGQPIGSLSGTTSSQTEAAVTDGTSADETDADETTEVDSTDSTVPTDTAQTPATPTNQCTVDLTQDPAVLAALNHGSVVCTAAQQTTWDKTLYPTHGAWVSHWAHLGKAKFGASPKTHGKG